MVQGKVKKSLVNPHTGKVKPRGKAFVSRKGGKASMHTETYNNHSNKYAKMA